MILTLGRSAFTHQAVTYAHGWMHVCGISRRISFKRGGGGGENVKPEEIQFYEK